MDPPKYHPGKGKTTVWLNRDSPFFFVDQYNMEFNRGIQPMKGGYTDNYYMQMAQNIRRYKGIRPIPELAGYVKTKIDSRFDDWAGLPPNTAIPRATFSTATPKVTRESITSTIRDATTSSPPKWPSTRSRWRSTPKRPTR